MFRDDPSSLRWALLYEIVYAIIVLPTGLLFFRSPTLPVLSFIKKHGFLYSMLCIWLNNTASYFLGAPFVILTPLAGLFIMSYFAIVSGKVLASFLSGHCPLPHLIYAILLEDQAYITLWAITTKVYYVQTSCEDLVCKWNKTLRLIKKLAVYAFLTFFILAIIEVFEVIAFA